MFKTYAAKKTKMAMKVARKNTSQTGTNNNSEELHKLQMESRDGI